MRKVKLNHLQEGMVTAYNIMTRSGQCIMKQGTTLTPELILRLSFYSIDSVLVEDAIDGNAASSAKPEEDISYSSKVKASSEFLSFQFDHSLVLSAIKRNLDQYVNQGILPKTAELLKQTRRLFDTCETSLDLFDMLNNMRSSDDSVYVHSLNVALISRILGKWLKMSDADLDLLTLCGLYHDIGKLMIPADILNKPTKYTDAEFALVQTHTRHGFELLKPLPIDARIKKTALSHHERCDGSGYPMGIKQNDIGSCGMIVAIADVYDAMTAARPHRAPLCPFEVIDCFERDGLQKYNPKYILTFLSHVAMTYQNNRVQLNDGRSAKIVMLNKNSLSKPIIRFDDNTCLDLSAQNKLYIQAIL